MEGSTRTVAAVILDLLANEGVKKAFGIPGVHNLGFWNALSKDRPEIVSVRHEQSCVYAADGLARASNPECNNKLREILQNKTDYVNFYN